MLLGDAGPQPEPAVAAAPTSPTPGHLIEFDAARVPSRLADPTTTAPSRARHRHHKPSHRPPSHRPPARAARSSSRAPLTGDPRAIGQAMVAARGWSIEQWHCLDLLWTKESDWQVHNTNASSGAYGIPQSLPGDKMAAFGSDWRDNPVTQIRWGLWYIADRYGTPCAAWAHSQAYDFY